MERTAEWVGYLTADERAELADLDRQADEAATAAAARTKIVTRLKNRAIARMRRERAKE